MSVSVHTGGATHAASVSFRDASASLQRVAVGMVRNVANALKLFTSSLSVALSSDVAFGKVNSALSVPVTTRTVDVTPTGGAGPYSYAWAMVSSTGGTWSASAPTGPTTSFTGGTLAPGDTLSSVWHCTVTDSAGNVSVSDTVTATVTNIGFSISGGGGPLP